MYKPLTQDQRKELQHEWLFFSGNKIAYFFKGVQVGLTDLPEQSSGHQRLRIAEMIGVKEFDDYHLLNADETVRGKASELKGMHITDIDADYGQAQGLKYQMFLKRHLEDRCPNCGHELKRENS